MVERATRRPTAQAAGQAAGQAVEQAVGRPVIVEEREHFEREYGCTEREWIGWMPAATEGRECIEDGPQALRVRIGTGHLRLRWQVLPPRVIALIRLPRLAVTFTFAGVPLAPRREFLRRFDLRLHRGGG